MAVLVAVLGSPLRAAPKTILEFTRTDSGYQTAVTLATSLAPEEFIDSLWQPWNVRAMSGYADTLVFLASNDSVQVVKAEFHYLFYRGFTVFRRARTSELGHLGIELIEFSHNWDAIPSPHVFRTYYRVTASDTGSVVRYDQTVVLDRAIGWLGIRIAQRQLSRFADQLSRLVEQWEDG